MTDTELPPTTDYTVRAMTDDSAFRVIVARSTETVREICKAQSASGEAGKTLGDLLTATILFRETMSPTYRVQGILRSPEGQLVADSAPEGHTRGLLQLKGNAAKLLHPEGKPTLQMMRTLKNGSVNQGIVRVPESGDVTQAMMAYMKDSEQVDSMLAVSTILDNDGQVKAAAGYMVQLLPEVGRGPLAVMAERLEDFRNIDRLLTDDFTPESLRDELLYAMPFTPLDKSQVAFSCWCSESRVLGALATLNRSEIQSMIDDGSPLEIDCDYCLKNYVIQTATLAGLLSSN